MAPNLGDVIRRKQQRIVELRAEIAALQAELKEARRILAGKQPGADASVPTEQARVLRHRSAPASAKRGRTRAIKEGSTVWWARRLLQFWAHDEHIDLIVSEIARATGQTVSKATVVSNLSRYVSKDDTFTRPAPNRYGLINYGEKTVAG